jgi:hypothetical protein
VSLAGAPSPTVDVFDFFAARGSETKNLQVQLGISKRNEERLQQEVKDLKQTILLKEVTHYLPAHVPLNVCQLLDQRHL